MSLTLFTLTVGEPSTLEAIDRIVAATPKPFDLTVWYDLCGESADKDFYARLRKRTDNIIILTKNHGPTAAVSYAMLHIKTDYLVIFGSDSMVKPNYYDRLWLPFGMFSNMAITGEPFREMDFGGKDFLLCGNEGVVNFPDPLIMVNHKAVDEIGGIGNFFNFYGYDITEWTGRAIYMGWEAAIVSGLLERKALTQSSILKNEGIQEIAKKNEKIFLAARDMGYKGYKWWSSKFQYDKEVTHV